MYRNELLEMLRPMLDDYDYTSLSIWTAKREKTLWWKTKFSVSPTMFGRGYYVGSWPDTILVWSIR